MLGLLLLALAQPTALTRPKPAADEQPPLVAPPPLLAPPPLRAPPPMRAPPHLIKAAAVLPPKKPDRYKEGLWLSVGAGGGFAVGGPLRLGGSARVALGYVRPHELDHLGISLEPEAQFASNPQSTELSVNLQTQGFFLAVPLLVSLNVPAGPGLFRGLVGPALDYIALGATTAGSHAQDEGWLFGFAAGAQYLFELPLGLLGLDVRFHYAPYRYQGEKTDGVLFSVGAAYAFTL